MGREAVIYAGLSISGVPTKEGTPQNKLEFVRSFCRQRDKRWSVRHDRHFVRALLPAIANCIERDIGAIFLQSIWVAEMKKDVRSFLLFGYWKTQVHFGKQNEAFSRFVWGESFFIWILDFICENPPLIYRPLTFTLVFYKNRGL